jgi:hypothetical protein
LFVYAIVLLFLPRSLDILFRNLYFMNLILMTKYTLSIEFVLAQVRGNNHWRTSQVRLKILNYRTLYNISITLLILHVTNYSIFFAPPVHVQNIFWPPPSLVKNCLCPLKISSSPLPSINNDWSLSDFFLC